MLKYSETPILEFTTNETRAEEIRILVKREDLNHPLVSGNKWWKLKYNLLEARRLGMQRILTFGGAYSNHIYATAAAARECGFKSIGIIRGEETLPLNDTLAFATERGMELHYLTRARYKQKTHPTIINELKDRFGDFFLVPEGGNNGLAVKGCAEWGRKLSLETSFDYLCLPVGTGGTLAGILSQLNGKKEVIGFAALKGGGFLRQEVEQYLDHCTVHWRIEDRYHFGGYARLTDELRAFTSSMEVDHGLALDPVYTAKMMFGVFDLIRRRYFRRRSTILVLHTGGLQGRRGFNL